MRFTLFILILSTTVFAQDKVDKSNMYFGIDLHQYFDFEPQVLTETARLSFGVREHKISLGSLLYLTNSKLGIERKGLELIYQIHPIKQQKMVSPYLLFRIGYLNTSEKIEFYSNHYSEEVGFSRVLSQQNCNHWKSLLISGGFGFDVNISKNFYFTASASLPIQWDEGFTNMLYYKNGEFSYSEQESRPATKVTVQWTVGVGYRLWLNKRKKE